MNLVDTLEALLFASPSPLSIGQIAIALSLTEGQVAQAIEILEARLADRGSLQLSQIAGGYQLSTRSEYAETLARVLKPQTQRLTRTMLEVLAVVAYRQPVTAAEIEDLRGVQSDYGLRALVERRLIQEVGRKKTPGRPLLYGTTQQFLHQFNLENLDSLPPIDDDPHRADLEVFHIR